MILAGVLGEKDFERLAFGVLGRVKSSEIKRSARSRCSLNKLGAVDLAKMSFLPLTLVLLSPLRIPRGVQGRGALLPRRDPAEKGTCRAGVPDKKQIK